MGWFMHLFEETLAFWAYLFWEKFAREESDEDPEDLSEETKENEN